MGDSRSAIHDDEVDWDDLQRRAGISKRVDSNPYSFEASKAKVGFDRGTQAKFFWLSSAKRNK